MVNLKDVVGDEPIIISPNLNLEKFARTYILAALKLADSSPSLDDFDNGIRKIVSKELGMSISAVKYLHHPFHWLFFNNPASPLEYVQSTTYHKSASILLTRCINANEEFDLTSKFFKMYGSYFKERVKILQQAVS